MKNQIRAFVVLLLPVFLLSACVSNGVKKEPIVSKIEEISTTRGSGTVAPKYRTSTTMKLGSDLSLTKVTKDYMGTITTKKTVKITQSQFDELVKDLDGVDISKLKFKTYPYPKVGGGTSTLTIVKSEGSHGFTQNGSTDFPPVIAVLFHELGSMVSN